MKRHDLKSGWVFTGLAPQGLEARNVNLPPGDCQWLAIDVPGDVNAALVGYGRMPDPRHGVNGRDCYWVTEKDWWYRLAFDAPVGAEAADLCLTEVDGPADLWLNGRFVGTMSNAFRMHRFGISEMLKAGANELLIRFRSIDGLLGPRLDELKGWMGRRAFLRKPQFNFGWDWALPLPSVGLAGDIYIETDHQERLADVHLRTFADGRVDFFLEVSPQTLHRPHEIRVSVKGHGADIKASPQPRSGAVHKSYLSILIPDPQLWWPNGYGRPDLYDYSVELLVEGRVVDRRDARLGLREVRIKERPFEPAAGPGFSFEVEVNGQTIFCKGGNFIPCELWPGMVKPEQVERHLRKTVEANFNIQRIWGGGIYERDYFYDLCDELGIMVWQDFMFAGAGYPADQLRHEIIAEADYQLRRLRNHPCICLWCGCNEDVFSWRYHSDQPSAPAGQADVVEDSAVEAKWQVDRLVDDPQIYSMILRGLVGKMGCGVPYVESSPASHDDSGNMPNSGNCHISAWKYGLFETPARPARWREHFDQTCSFDSEFCIQGPCAEATFRKFFSPKDLWPPNEAWVYHIQRGHRDMTHFEQTMFIAGDTFGLVDSLGRYVKYGQALHAEMMRCQFESARRDRPNSGGTMMWMFNDCWPTSNWSIIDYFGREKPCFFAAKRACRPAVPIIMPRRGQIEFFLGNDSLGVARAEITFGQADLEGRRVWSRQISAMAAANSTQKLASINRGDLDMPPGHHLFMDAVVDGAPLPEITFFPDGWRGIDWPAPRVSLREVDKGPTADGRWRLLVNVSADKYARFLHLLTGQEEGGVTLSDNYFDLPAGQARQIEITTKEELALAQVTVGHWWTDWP